MILTNRLKGISSSASILTLSFDYNAYGADVGGLVVYALDTSGNLLGTVYQDANPTTVAATWASVNGVEFEVSQDCYIVFRHYGKGASFNGDLTVANITINDVLYSIDSTNAGFTTSTVDSAIPTQVFASRAAVATSTAAATSKWSRDTGGTPSASTGPSVNPPGSTYYFYTETSSPNTVASMDFWLFSPVVTP